MDNGRSHTTPTMELAVRLKVSDVNNDTLGNYRVRTICNWSSTYNLSGVFGQDSLEWTSPAAEESEDTEGNAAEKSREKSELVASADFTQTLSANLNDEEALKTFNADPGVYVMVIKEDMQKVVKTPPPEGEENVDTESIEPEMELHLIPKAFLYLDPSSFLLTTDEPLKSCVKVCEGVYAEMELTCADKILDLKESLPMEPLILSFDSVDGYPVSSAATRAQAMESMYIKGTFETGIGNDTRLVYIRPQATEEGSVDENGNYRIPLRSQLILLPGVGSMPNFREGLRSRTYTVEVHKEQLFSRAFNEELVQQYHYALVGEGEEKGDPLDQPDGLAGPADTLLLDTMKNALAQSSCVNQHGLARYRLERLLDTSVDILKEFSLKRQEGEMLEEQNVLVTDEVFSDVRTALATKPNRWKPPSDVSLLRSLRKERGNASVVKKQYERPFHELYDDFNTSLYMSIKMHRFLGAVKDPPPKAVTAEMLQVTPFTRTVLVFNYADDATLQRVNEALTKVNRQALSNIQGSIRSYSFTEEEMEDVVNAKLDVITGFMVIDNDTRIVVMEGLAGLEKGMESVVKDLPRTVGNSKDLTMLANPNVLFQERLYGEFGPDLKRIRIRNNLPKLARKPEVYNRKLVSQQCFDAIDHVMHLRWAPDLLSSKEMEMFPTAAALNAVELLYGEAISRADLDGVGSGVATSKGKKAKTTTGGKKDETLATSVQATTESVDAAETQAPRRILQTKLAPTDSSNASFEELLRTRPLHRVDYLAEQKDLLAIALENKEERLQMREEKCKYVLEKVLGNTSAKIHIYACQKENFKIKSYNSVREDIKKREGDATYTYSKDLLTGTIAAVDPEEMKRMQANPNLLDRSAWLTPSGMQYPKPRTTKDLLTHPKRPSDSRIDELKEPWILDLPLVMQDPHNTFDPTDSEYLRSLRLERGYTTRIKGGEDFGALKPAEYQREFQLNKVGHRKTLPRGNLTQGYKGDKDPWAFRSVHLVKPEVTKAIEEAQEQDKKDWMGKVKVDSLSFKVDGFNTRDKTLPFKRCDDILHDEPVREELKHLRNRTGELGTDFSYAPPPLSIFKGEPYVANQAANAMTRHTDKTKFITSTKPGETQGEDFRRFISKYDNAPRLVRLIHDRKHPPLHEDSSERVGAKWGQ